MKLSKNSTFLTIWNSPFENIALKKASVFPLLKEPGFNVDIDVCG
jgi:hypothetical protein